MLNLGCFGPRGPNIQGLFHNILADIILRGIEKFADAVSSFGPHAKTVLSMRLGISFSVNFYNDQIEKHADWCPQCNPAEICAFFLQASLVYNRNIPYAAASTHAQGSRHSASRGSLVIPTTDSNHIIIPFFSQNVSSNLRGNTLLIKGMKFVAGKEMLSFTLKQPTTSAIP